MKAVESDLRLNRWLARPVTSVRWTERTGHPCYHSRPGWHSNFHLPGGSASMTYPGYHCNKMRRHGLLGLEKRGACPSLLTKQNAAPRLLLQLRSTRWANRDASAGIEPQSPLDLAHARACSFDG